MRNSNSDKIIIFYHYFEANQNYKDNLVHFLSVAYSESYQFVIVISGKCTIELPQLENITYIFAENKNNDFGGYIYALSNLKNLNNYDYFIFINASVRGPFLSNHYEGTWVELFTSKMKNDVHLVGATINILSDSSPFYKKFKKKYAFEEPYSHVQTTAYALSNEAIRHLLKIGFYDVTEKLEKDDVICAYELRLSQEIKKNGWNMSCLLAHYDTIDYREFHTDMNYSSKNGNVLSEGHFFGRTAHPTEIVFIKTNTNMISRLDLSSHTYCNLLANTNPLLENWAEGNNLMKRAVDELKIEVALRKGKNKNLRRFVKYVERKIKKYTPK